jgi:phage terminase small subunit
MGPVIARARIPIQPPTGLSEAARAAFIALVTSCAPDHFEPSDVSLITRYAVASVLAEGAETTLQADPGNTKALAVWEKAVRTMSALALRLRLGPQSRREKAKVQRPLTWSDEFRLRQAGRGL